jgi:transcriptional regulator with XRE-family HTH domain
MSSAHAAGTDGRSPLVKVRELLRARREACGLSARRLSINAGLSDSMIGKVESGEVQPSLRTFAQIAAQLHLSDREIALLVRLAAIDTDGQDRR